MISNMKLRWKCFSKGNVFQKLGAKIMLFFDYDKLIVIFFVLKFYFHAALIYGRINEKAKWQANDGSSPRLSIPIAQNIP